MFAPNDVIPVPLDSSSTLVSCSAHGGFPAPDITAHLEDEGGQFIRPLQELTDLTSEETNDLGDSVLTKEFLFIPHIEDCGNLVVCDVIQGDGVLGTKMARKIMVVYAPQPVSFDNPFEYLVRFQDIHLYKSLVVKIQLTWRMWNAFEEIS